MNIFMTLTYCNLCIGFSAVSEYVAVYQKVTLGSFPMYNHTAAFPLR